MKQRFKVDENVYIVVDNSNGYHAKIFRNGCSHNMMEYKTNNQEEMEQWVKKTKEVLNGNL